MSTESWRKNFWSVLLSLVVPYHQHLAPHGYRIRERRLLACALSTQLGESRSAVWCQSQGAVHLQRARRAGCHRRLLSAVGMPPATLWTCCFVKTNAIGSWMFATAQTSLRPRNPPSVHPRPPGAPSAQPSGGKLFVSGLLLPAVAAAAAAAECLTLFGRRAHD